MSNKGIPQEIKEQIEKIVQTFNTDVIKNPNYFFTTRYRGRYLYFSRGMFISYGPVCRLKYTGKMDDWEFAIYKYSDERYDPDDWFFPGSENVDGTIQGALHAGLKAYP